MRIKQKRGGEVSPYEKFSGFVFKIQANMNPPIVIELLLFEFVQVFLKEAWT